MSPSQTVQRIDGMQLHLPAVYRLVRHAELKPAVGTRVHKIHPLLLCTTLIQTVVYRLRSFFENEQGE